MIVFSTYFKIIKRNFMSIFLTFFIFIGVSLLFVNMNNSEFAGGEYNLKSMRIGVINNSSSSENKGLEQYLKENFTVRTLKNDEKAFKDALFYQSVDYVLLMNDDTGYQDYRVPNSSTGVLINSFVNGYLNTYENFKSAGVYTEEELTGKTLKNLNEKVAVKNISSKKDTGSIEKSKSFYNLFAYGIIGTIISGIGVIGLVLDKKEILKRTIISKTSVSQRNLQLLLGHICFAALVWLASNIVGVFITGIEVFSHQHYLFMLNSFVFVISITSLSFLLSSLIRSYNAISAVTNLLALFLSFTSGIFIPQIYLSSYVLKISSFLPAYWYVTVNEKIAGNENLGLNALLQPSVIMLCMAAAFIAVGLVIAKQKKNY